tara:strand:+ start:784 stop:1074 length:291 start_codon:yes stop_codon:yes gene_type:complete
MLRLVGMYIPFVLVILGIGACSFIYQDEFFGQFKSNEELVENESTELSGDQTNDEESSIFEEVITEPTDNSDSQESNLESLPGIGECVCPKTDDTL